MIPKKIHYIWLGGQAKPNSVIKQIDSWKQKLPDYQIKEWNETNYDFSKIKSKYIQQAIQKKMWAFVSDYVRLDILNEEGGIYMDTDVEVLKNFDDLLNNKSFIGRESQYTLSTATIGSKPGQPWLNDLIQDYDQRTFISSNGTLDKKPNSKYILSYFVSKYGFHNTVSDKKQVINGVTIYPITYFSPMNFLNHKMNVSDNTVVVHHYSGTWKSPSSRFKDAVLMILNLLLSENVVESLKRKLK